MKLYQLSKHSYPMLVVSAVNLESIRDVLSKYIPMQEQLQAFTLPDDVDVDKYTIEDDVNLLLCTESGLEFTLSDTDY